MESPEYVIHLAGKIFHSPKRIAHPKACSIHRCKVNISGKLAPYFSMLTKASRKKLFRKFLAKSDQSDRYKPGIILKIIEHVSYNNQILQNTIAITSREQRALDIFDSPSKKWSYNTILSPAILKSCHKCLSLICDDRIGFIH